MASRCETRLTRHSRPCRYLAETTSHGRRQPASPLGRWPISRFCSVRPPRSRAGAAFAAPALRFPHGLSLGQAEFLRLRIEMIELHGAADGVVAQLPDDEPAPDVGLVDTAVVPVARPVTAELRWR